MKSEKKTKGYMLSMAPEVHDQIVAYLRQYRYEGTLSGFAVRLMGEYIKRHS
jgi:hypothetical protein